jgi:hypothetical protein
MLPVVGLRQHGSFILFFLLATLISVIVELFIKFYAGKQQL